jgi:putative serine protease PepD
MTPIEPGDERRHLTWRDLPPTPPTGSAWSAAEPQPAPVYAAAPQPRRTPRRRTLAIGAAAIALCTVGVVAAIAAPSLASGPATALTGSPSDQSLNGGSAPTQAPGAGGTGNGSQPGATSQPTTPPAGTSGSEPLADTAARILPSVVQIETGSGLGSGFVADTKGDILTANHVVEGSRQVSVKLQDGSTVAGTVVATDPSIDVAVVRIDRTDIAPLTLADSDQVRVGQVAIAVGSPFGLDETVTSGIVSALDRTLDTGATQQTGLIQTDTPINPGNSGGPLTDKDGNVIGINDAIASTSGQSSGVGFAIPINQAKTLLEQAQNGTATQPQTGQSNGNGGSNGSNGNGTDPFGGLFGNGNGTDPFGGLFGNGNGTDPFGGLFGNGNGTSPFGNSDPNSGNSQQDQLFQWFFDQVLPGLQGQSGANQ